ncbi:hypothetical protein Tco_0770892 [Tanacetum coccineum]|uniref:Uncharacterized protein n=1 Tax=Tanacetum coccineum TaxID=301880 RepID=A0ABQ4ZFE1_9ASTR
MKVLRKERDSIHIEEEDSLENYYSMLLADDANRSPEDTKYTMDILTRCVVSKDELSKKTMKIVPLKEHGEPVVVSVPTSQPSLFVKLAEKKNIEDLSVNVGAGGGGGGAPDVAAPAA